MLQNYVACLGFPGSADSGEMTRLPDVEWPRSGTYDEGVLEEREDAGRIRQGRYHPTISMYYSLPGDIPIGGMDVPMVP